MSSRDGGRLRLWIEKFRKTAPEPAVEASRQGTNDQEVSLSNPVDEYYQQRVQGDRRAFYRFAIQSRSILIRDVFAKACSAENLNLGDLLNVISNLDADLSVQSKAALRARFDLSILLSLADLLANTARHDLDTAAAVQLYDFVYSVAGVTNFSDQQILLYVEALNEAWHFDRAERLAEELSLGEISPLQPELLALQRLRREHTFSSPHWITKLNELYSSLNMTQVQLLDDEAVPLLDRLTVETFDRVNGPKVSVIVPTFCPGPGIRTAIRGLLEQTWHNLEIIVVDDASPVEYQNIFSELAELDPRVRVIRQERNAGAYVARNAGLLEATGDFITTADDDDWSHPDKVALQVSAILEDENIVGSLSEHIRTTDALEFRRVNQSARYLQINYSSLMVRRQVIEEIGHWDTVNRGGDSEFLMRLRKFYGSDKLAVIRAKPLAFSRLWDGSLTSGEMYRGFTATPRVLHIWAIRQWHWDLARIDQKPTRSLTSTRPYSVPSSFEPGQRGKNVGSFDIIYVTDFFRQAKYVDYVLQEMKTLSLKGLTIGYVHLDSPRTTKINGLPRALLEAQFEGRISQVSLEDAAETRLLVVYDPAVAMFLDERQSKIKSQRSVLVERELPSLSITPDRSPTDYLQALSHLDQTFDAYFEIVGTSNRDYEKVASRVPPSRLLEESMIWRTHIELTEAQIRPPGEMPVVGYHTYGNKYRWPRNERTFREVYLSKHYETHFSGQLEPAFNKFGRDLFSTSKLFDYHDTSTRAFLDDIDFWVYYPDPRLQEDVWEPVLLAMSAGKVVILPPSLENIYQEGAVYAHPDEVEGIVHRLSSHSRDFETQAQRGQNFVKRQFSAEQLYERVSRLLQKIK